ncbi:hypothetical protein [Lacticaseibacillus absianus]|uniref:hypothetical protein n=1 Tax=Lacticaseibacillus absianus TaxID=2729623 RepID=UPI0015C74E16|nr:hypothetical protein [Lacticaseibacillus absianus]
MSPFNAAATAIVLIIIQTGIILHLIPMKRRGRSILIGCSVALCVLLLAVMWRA